MKIRIELFALRRLVLMFKFEKIIIELFSFEEMSIGLFSMRTKVLSCVAVRRLV